MLGRVKPNGTLAVAPALGGADGTTLFLMTALGTGEDIFAAQCAGQIEMMTVDVPGAGSP